MNRANESYKLALFFLLVGVLSSAHAASAGGLCPGDPNCEMPFPENAGPEIWVDGPEAVDLPGDDRFSEVAVDEMGRRIYVWTNFFPTNPERGEIVLRRFDADGNPLEDPRVINTTSDSDQARPRVAVAGDGSFLVAWESSEFDPDDNTNRLFVRSQLFAVDGTPSGPEQLLSTLSSGTGTPITVDVAALRAPDGSNGGFVAVWKSFNTDGLDNSGSSIQARLVSAAGAPTGDQFEVNSTIAGTQRDAAVAELPDGGFLVVWADPGLEGQRFSAAGAPIGDQFQINTEFASAKFAPDAAVGWDGVIAVVWRDPEDPGNFMEIRARLYRLSGDNLNALGSDFRINSLLIADQVHPRVGEYGPKGFLVTWQSDSSVGGDLSRSTQARLMTGHDAFEGDQVQFNLYESSFQDSPASHGWYGRVGSTWRSDGNDQDPAPSDEHITGRDIEYCLYCDDFEWFQPGSQGSLWRWSSTLGAAP